MGKGEPNRWVCVIEDLDESNSRFSPYTDRDGTEKLYSIDQLVYDHTECGCRIFFVKWRDVQLCYDGENDYEICDVTRPSDKERITSLWKAVSPPLHTIEAALDYPALDGKSLRERWDECRLYD